MSPSPDREISAVSPDRRQQIIEVAADLFASQGYRATSMRQIGSKVGILGGSLYHHFASKEDLLDAILNDLWQDLLHRYEEIAFGGDRGATDRLEQLIRASVEIIRQRRTQIRVFQNESANLAKSQRFDYLDRARGRQDDIWLGVIKAAVREGGIRSDLEPELVHQLIWSMLAGVIRDKASEWPADQTSEAMVRLVFEGLRVERGANGPSRSSRRTTGES